MKDPSLIAFGEKVRQIRKEKGLSQEALADLAGIDRSYMGHIERGDQNITLTKIYQIADALGRVQKNFICFLERIPEGGALWYDSKKAIVGNHNHRVDTSSKFCKPLVGLTFTFLPLERERPSDDPDRECAHIARNLGDGVFVLGVAMCVHQGNGERLNACF